MRLEPIKMFPWLHPPPQQLTNRLCLTATMEKKTMKTRTRNAPKRYQHARGVEHAGLGLRLQNLHICEESVSRWASSL
jgi:hypothetical protein